MTNLILFFSLPSLSLLFSIRFLCKRCLSNKEIDQWSEFIPSHLYRHDMIAYRYLSQNKPHQLSYRFAKKRQKELCKDMLSNLSTNDFKVEYYSDVKKIQAFSNYLDKCLEKQNNYIFCCNRVNALIRLDLANEKKYFKKMTNREYLNWRLNIINEEQEKPISVKSTIGLTFSSLAGVYCFFTPKTKLLVKILMGILNLLVVVALVCTIILNLSLYFLIPVAIIYGLFVLESCIHVGCKRYIENVKYQEEFGNT